MTASKQAPGAMAAEPAAQDAPRFMNVRQVARYLQINEKKVYALVNEGRIPATRLTGKWLFPARSRRPVAARVEPRGVAHRPHRHRR